MCVYVCVLLCCVYVCVFDDVPLTPNAHSLAPDTESSGWRIYAKGLLCVVCVVCYVCCVLCVVYVCCVVCVCVRVTLSFI